MQPPKILLISTLTSILLVIGTGHAGNKSDQTYEQLWEQARQLNEKQLPQSALQLINQLYDKALAEGNHQQMMRALIFSFSLRQSFEDGVLKNAIAQTQRLAEKSASPVKEIAHSLLAEMYWFHYQANRHRVLDRAATAVSLSDDPDEWDPLRYRDVVLSHYQQSLRNQVGLEGIPLSDWHILLEKHDESAMALQPTLFDFLAGRYLNFLSSSDAALHSRIPLAEALPATLWQPATLFITLEIPKQDHETLIRLRLLQRILTSNIRLGNTYALINNELQRYKWLRSLTENDKAYLEALNNLQQQYANNPASAEVAAEIADFLLSGAKPEGIEMPMAEALRICDQTLVAHPGSRGAQRCAAMRNFVLKKELSLRIQRTEYPGTPIAAWLSYRNISKPTFRIASVSSKKLSRIVQDFDQERRIKALLELKVLSQWQVDLPFEPDYAEHSTIIALPALEPGLYVLLASDHSSFEPENIIVFTSFQVSRLSFMHVNRQGTNTYVVLDRESGHPVGGAKVRVNLREYDYKRQETIETTVKEIVTPKHGQFSIGPEEKRLSRNRSFYLEISQGSDTLMSDNYFDVYKMTEPDRTQRKTWFFTDRAIYRPGQPVYFKGITLIKDSGRKWQPDADQRTTVHLYDVNGRTVGTISLKTNDYGSFEGSFVLPSTVLTGTMRLSNEQGITFIQVEEYKRPTFEVTIQEPENQILLGQSVQIKAKAMAFAGYPLDGAKVEYRIERQQFVPWIPWWKVIPVSNVKQLIKQGHTTTAVDGSFVISLDALPDFNQAQNESMYYDFQVTVWVTDRNGEVRQAASNIRIGNRSLSLKTNLPGSVNRRKAADYQISLSTLQGQPAAAQTTLNFYRIESGKQVVRPSLFGTPDRKLLDNKTLNDLFPYDDFYSSPSPDSLKKNLVFTIRQLINGKAPALPKTIAQWPEGEYLAEFISIDMAGLPVKLQHRFTLYDPASRHSPANHIFWVNALTDSLHLGDTLNVLMASSHRGMRVLVEFSSNEKVFLRRWVTIGARKKDLKLVLDPTHIGSLSVQVSGIALNRQFYTVFDLRIADPQQQINLKPEIMAERLQPGKPEQWTISVSGANNKPVVAELLAAMYDASLEQFKPHRWFFDPVPFQPFAQRWMGDNGFGIYESWPIQTPEIPWLDIQSLAPPAIEWYGFNFRIGNIFYPRVLTKGLRQSEATQAVDMGNVLQISGKPADNTEQTSDETVELGGKAARNIRTDFRETAFFYPQLRTDSLGRVSFRFTPPDALTRWRLMLLAHTPQLQHDYRTYDFEASKPLLVVPNLSRFYRLGDTAVMSCKVVNTGTETLDGMAMLELSDAVTGRSGGVLLDAGTKPLVQLRPGQSLEVRWNVLLNYSVAMLKIRFSASAGTFTDAEEHLVPLLPSGIRLTESLPLFVKGNSTGTFVLPGLEKPSPREQNLRLKLELTTRPAWLAVKALPYATDAGYDNADNIFRRYYANTLASHVAASVPNFKEVVATWNQYGSPSMQSELQTNQDVKMLPTDLTPWLGEAESEQQQRQRLVRFFDTERISWEQEQALEKLEKLQMPDGAWPWFPGMRGNLWITLNILEGIGKLKQMDQDLLQNPRLASMVERAVGYLDRQAAELYARRKKEESLGNLQMQMLSTRSYFPEIASTSEATKAYAAFGALLEKDWTKMGIQEQARAALHLHRVQHKKLALQIAKSLRERAVRSDKLGIWWKAGSLGDEALPIESHAMLVQVFELVAADRLTADGIRQYLLTQKQTRRWVSAPATAEAVYALLMYGTDWTSVGKPVQVWLGNQSLDIDKSEAGTGYFSKEWDGSSISPAMAKTAIENPNAGILWGAWYRQYEVPVDAVRQRANEVKLSREIMVERIGPKGVVSETLRAQPLKPGDRILVRMILETNRDLEFIHLSDLRSPALEPVDVISGYQYRNGLGFYQSTRDASTEFFFDWLPRGKHVFEYKLTVMHSGRYSGGFARMQSYYAPAFSANSGSMRLQVD